VRGLRLRPDLETGTVAFDIRADGPVELVAYLGGEPVARASSENGRGRLRPEMVRPWSPDSPVLYDLEVRLFDRDGRVLDQVESYFGFRTVEAQDGRFRLNGEPFFQRLVLDQGYFPAGLLTAPDGAALKRDIELAKAFGFDGARKHQKIEDPRWLYWADVLGFLVWEEMPGFHEHSPAAEERLAREWAEAVRRDRDHACIVAWVPFNESFGLDALSLPRRAQLLVRLYELTHELDGSRPVVDNDGWEHALTDLCTLHDYGVGVARPAYLPGYAYRGEPLIVSEFGGVKLAGPGWGYSEARGPDELLSRYASLLDGLATSGDVQGFCYTQLTDVEQERNGLLGFDREPKLEPALVREVNGRIAKCGEKPKNGPYSSY
jgi:beta-galactosidase/beta-glucuronidase